MFHLKDTIKFDNEEYVIDEFLGQGGMGQVFSIISKKDKSKLALKSLQYFIPDDNHHRSIINEWEKAKTIRNPNVIKYIGYHDGLTEPKTPYLIMEFASEGSLEEFLKSQRDFFSEEECLSIFHQIINGMEAVNSALIHRDIKPDNIFIDNGVFKIADFGLAKIASDKTRTRTFKGWGTEPYIAPEAYRSETNTIQMDMYAIGLVFYQIAGMKHAYGSPSDWEQAHLTAVPNPVNNVNTKISPKVASVINKLIAKRSEDRYEAWSSVRNELINSAENNSEHKSAIDSIIKNKVARDTEEGKKLSERQIAEKEINRKAELIDFQFENEIRKPLREFVENFNKVSGSAMKMTSESFANTTGNDSGFRVMFDNKLIEIWHHHIDETDVLERQVKNVWGETEKHLVKPKLNDKHVLSWGGIETPTHSGLNIVLISPESGEYGDWFILKNKRSGFYDQQNRSDHRVDPFAFSRDELITEIHKVNSMHIYETTVIPLDINYLVTFISDSL